MKKPVFFSVLVAFFLGVFETSILAYFSLLPVSPDLVLVLILYLAIYNGSRVGIWTGFFSGLAIDFLSISPIGLHSFTFTLIGYLVGKLYDRYNLNKFFVPIVLAFSATLIKAALFFVLHLLFGTNIKVYNVLGLNFWIEVGINALCAPILFGLLNIFPTVFQFRESVI
ncbi:rod shape-determining protein MreD [Treponema phagedenis F0421]|uniref:rod shape-determining protein MreD n=1 Tax=Treponema phagedenis TaxID=162 RepID=UPI0001F63F3C|nr:rod shape-determining protein MreD [Treponema phagedenis]EFW37485.1 rod shape-determining protein MreD [Treponema phagedenis F0421]